MDKTNPSQLKHYGILGMRWGVRRYQNKDGSLTSAGRRRLGKDGDGDSDSAKAVRDKKHLSSHKSVKDMTDDELRERIARLDMEKRYAELSAKVNPPPSRKGREFAMRVLEKSGENLCTQVVNHLGAKALNKVLGEKTKVTDKDTGEITTVIKDVIFANNKKKDK